MWNSECGFWTAAGLYYCGIINFIEIMKYADESKPWKVLQTMPSCLYSAGVIKRRRTASTMPGIYEVCMGQT